MIKVLMIEDDLELAEMFIGDALDIKEIKEVFEKQYQEIHDGKKWFLPGFAV